MNGLPSDFGKAWRRYSRSRSSSCCCGGTKAPRFVTHRDRSLKRGRLFAFTAMSGEMHIERQGRHARSLLFVREGSHMVRIVGFVVALIALAIVPGRAQDYPTHPIRILVPYAPGGISDIAARIIGGKLGEVLGQQVVVENKPGGNGFIAVTDAVRATPDGYTLVMVTTGDVSINPLIFKQIPYDVGHDLAPITAVSDAPVVLATNGKTPYKNVADVIAAAKTHPGELGVGTPGYGSINQLILEWMALNTDTKFLHVPYKGGAPAAQALVAGDIPFAVLASSSVAPHVANSSIRVLAVTAAK